MFDEKYGHFARQSGDDAKQFRAFCRRNAGAGLIEQQDFRPGRQRQRDLHQALLAVGQIAGQRIGFLQQMQRLEQVLRFLHGFALFRHGRHPSAGDTPAFADREHHRFQRRETGE